MPIELESATDRPTEPGQEAYEAICAVVVDAPELTLMSLLAHVQRGDSWSALAPNVRRLLVNLEGELFEGDGG